MQNAQATEFIPAQRSNVQSAAGTIVDEHMSPIAKTPALMGADSAKKEAIDSEVVSIRKSILSLYGQERLETQQRSQAWLMGLLGLYKSHSQEAIKASLKGRTRIKGEKATTEDVQLSYARTVWNAYLSFQTDLFNALTHDTNGVVLFRDKVLENLRTAMKAKAQEARDKEMAGEIQKTLLAAGIPADQIVAKTAATLENRKAIEEAEKEAAITPEMRGATAGKALVNKYTNAEGIADSVAINQYLDAMQKAVVAELTAE